MEDQSVKKYQLNILLILENKKYGSTATEEGDEMTMQNEDKIVAIIVSIIVFITAIVIIAWTILNIIIWNKVLNIF